jgi:hypothetical protein
LNPEFSLLCNGGQCAEKIENAKRQSNCGKCLKRQMLISAEWGRFINNKRGEKNKNRGERQKNSENQVTLDSIFGASKKHYLSNFVLYVL